MTHISTFHLTVDFIYLLSLDKPKSLFSSLYRQSQVDIEIVNMHRGKQDDDSLPNTKCSQNDLPHPEKPKTLFSYSLVFFSFACLDCFQSSDYFLKSKSCSDHVHLNICYLATDGQNRPSPMVSD